MKVTALVHYVKNVRYFKTEQFSSPKFAYHDSARFIAVNLLMRLQVGVPASCLEEKDNLWSRLGARMVELAACSNQNVNRRLQYATTQQ